MQNAMRNHKVSILIVLSLIFSQANAQMRPQAVAVGDKVVKGKNIKPYDNTWSMSQHVQGEWREVATIQEILESESQDVMVRKQITRIPSRKVERVQTMRFLGSTLTPIELALATPKGELPPAAPKEVGIEYSKNRAKGSVTNFEGKSSEIDIDMKKPMFETAMLGLVIAALPLEEGFVAQLPTVFANQGSKWTITASVAGRESYKTIDGKKVEAWIVNTEWQDLDSDAVSKGGATESGGAYSIVTNPPKGFPYVPRYVNNSVDIKLITEESKSLE